MKKLTIQQFNKHIDETIEKIIASGLEEQIEICERTPITITYSNRSVELPNNADTLTGLQELLRDCEE